MKPRILAFAGSTRKDSLNKKLLKCALLGTKDAHVTQIDLKDFPLPLYDGDLETLSGLPPQAKTLKNLFIETDGFLIASPEYNSSISGVLKNCIDWVSRPESKDEPPLIAFKNKTAAILSASPSPLGGLRGLIALRSILENIGVLVLPKQMTFPLARTPIEEKDAKRARSIGENLMQFLIQHKGLQS